ncbi:hypothetical protein ACFLZP_03290 [Patescibacteria group bacterium]
MIKRKRQLQIWYASGVTCYYQAGRSLDKLDRPQVAFGPSNKSTEFGFHGYSAPGSVIPGLGRNRLVCFSHEEYWPSQDNHFPFQAAIGIHLSKNNGQNWQKKTTLTLGYRLKTNSERILGVGQPNVLIKDNQVFLYYTNWSTNGPDTIHLARAPRNNLTNPQAWQRYTRSGFARLDSEESVAVLPPPTQEANTSYTALASTSHNDHLGKFLICFETNIGFYLATSADAISWDTPQLVARFPQPHAQRKPGDTWYSYPTLLSPKARSDRETSQTGYLYYSCGIWGQHHLMARKEFSIG